MSRRRSQRFRLTVRRAKGLEGDDVAEELGRRERGEGPRDDGEGGERDEHGQEHVTPGRLLRAGEQRGDKPQCARKLRTMANPRSTPAPTRCSGVWGGGEPEVRETAAQDVEQGFEEGAALDESGLRIRGIRERRHTARERTPGAPGDPAREERAQGTHGGGGVAGDAVSRGRIEPQRQRGARSPSRRLPGGWTKMKSR